MALQLCWTKKGNLLTGIEEIQKRAIDVYSERLKGNQIQNHLRKNEFLKEKLCDERLNITKNVKSEPWTEHELEKVLKFLENKKSRDPLDFCNELFKPENCGKDLKLALLRFMNKIKKQQKIPNALRLANISSLLKKGRRNDFSCYRGIFRTTIFRAILDRLMYNTVYPTIDNNLTDANVGTGL